LEPYTLKKTAKDSAYFTVNWSPLNKVDIHDIHRTVPAMPGIYELYYLDEKKSLNLFLLAKAWYGGLRGSIREKADPELEKNPNRIKILNDRTCLYRFTIIKSSADIDDVFFFFARTYYPDKTDVDDSGRYSYIYVNEATNDKIISR